MAGEYNVNVVVANIGALTNALQPLSKIAGNGGGISIIGATYTPGATSGTSAPQLVDLGTAGTAVDHVLADFGTVVNTAKIPTAATLQSNIFVDEGHYIGVRENNVGATPTVSVVGFNYIMGKA